MMGCMVSRGLWGLDCANTPCGWSWLRTGMKLSHVSWMQTAQPALEPTSEVAMALMTLLQTDRVTLQHLQPLLAASIETNTTEMWVQVRAPCCMVARSNEALPYVCPSYIPVF